jgi:tetratricopeptide (TPR) repeat protein
VQDKQGRHKKALENMERALSILRHCLPPTHPEIAASLSNIATHHYKNEQYSDAMTYYKDCLSIQEESLPSHHPDIVRTTGLLEHTARRLELGSRGSTQVSE